MRARYGRGPLHLAGLLACFAVAGYAALKAAEGPLPLRMAAWFVGAVLLHDFVLFPLYALADRALVRRAGTGQRGSVNWLRVPALLSGLLLLLFWPVVTQHSEPAYERASGLTQDGYLARYLLVVAVLFAASAVLRLVRRRP